MEIAPICAFCQDPIRQDERWEYWKAYPVGTPEHEKRRIHGRCFSQLLRQTIEALARIPEDKREEVYFDI